MLRRIFQIGAVLIHALVGSATSPNPIHSEYPYRCFMKPFYVRYMNHHVSTVLFPRGVRCLHAVFNPIDRDTFLFLFSGIVGNTSEEVVTFHGTIQRAEPESWCYHMLVSDFYHDLTLCMGSANSGYNYMYVTDEENRTGFGMMDSLTPTPFNEDAFRDIMYEKTNGTYYEVDHTDCVALSGEGTSCLYE